MTSHTLTGYAAGSITGMAHHGLLLADGLLHLQPAALHTALSPLHQLNQNGWLRQYKMVAWPPWPAAMQMLSNAMLSPVASTSSSLVTLGLHTHGHCLRPTLIVAPIFLELPSGP